MMQVLQLAYLLLPLLGGALANGLCIRAGWLRRLAVPLDGGIRFRGKRLFGPNKTVRGIVVAALGNMVVFGVQSTALHSIDWLRACEAFDYTSVNGWWFGMVMGMAAGLAELPNSFAKRQLDIAAGGPGRGAAGAIFYVVDQVDVLAGVWPVWGWVVQPTVTRVLLSVVLLFFAHQGVTLVGHALGLRRTRT
jgi:CDP-diglyceride synthetase